MPEIPSAPTTEPTLPSAPTNIINTTGSNSLPISLDPTTSTDEAASFTSRNPLPPPVYQPPAVQNPQPTRPSPTAPTGTSHINTNPPNDHPTLRRRIDSDHSSNYSPRGDSNVCDALEFAKFGIAALKSKEIELAIDRFERVLQCLRG